MTAEPNANDGSPIEVQTITYTGADGNQLAASLWEGAGSLPRIIMLHGGGQTRHSWDSASAVLARQTTSVMSYDARGHGDSDWVADGDYGLEAFARDLVAVLGDDDEPPVLIGASLGGMTALWAIVELGVRASGLVLVDIVPRGTESGARRIMSFMSQHARDGFATLEEVAEAINTYNPRPRKPDLNSLKKNVRQHSDGRWYWHWDPAFLDYGDEATRAVQFERLDEAVDKLDLPTLLVRGAGSDVVTPQAAQEFIDRVPGARLVEVQAGHMVVGDDNNVFVSHVLPFLSELSQ